MKNNKDHICKECYYMTYDILANARCVHPGKEGQAPIVSEYLPACYRFKSKYGKEVEK